MYGVYFGKKKLGTQLWFLAHEQTGTVKQIVFTLVYFGIVQLLFRGSNEQFQSHCHSGHDPLQRLLIPCLVG